MHQDCAAPLSIIGMCALQNELQSAEDKPNIFHQSRELQKNYHFLHLFKINVINFLLKDFKLEISQNTVLVNLVYQPYEAL